MNSNILSFYNPTDKLLEKSNDCYQYDSDGQEYIDFESGVWCANLGHSNDRITKTIELQMKESIHHGYRFRNRHAEALSEELLRITGIREGSSVFLSSGSEAVNLSISLASHITGRDKFLTMDNSYLSAYGPGKISPTNTKKVNIPFNSRLHIKNIKFNEIAAFVVETGGASVDMVQIPDYAFIYKILIEAKNAGCLIIADEVTTGMGRTGKWFGFQHYNFIPDMVLTGKALGNGYPVSAVTVNKEVANEFNKNPFRYAQSHQNDPLGCAIGLEVIKIIEENEMLETCQQSGNYFWNELEALKSRHKDKIKEVRGRGLMLALELADAVDDSQMDKKLFDNGFIVGYKANTFRFLPPLTITTKDIDHLIRTIDSLLRQMIDQKLKEIRSFCVANSNPDNIVKYSRYFKEGFDGYGLDQKIFEAQRDKWIAEWKTEMTIQQYLDLGELILPAGKYEEITFTICLLKSERENFSEATFDRIGKWFDKGIFNWASTDVLCMLVLSSFFIDKIVGFEKLKEWTKSGSEWQRRAVPVTLVELVNNGLKPEETFTLIDPIMLDKSEYVQKGIGTLLRGLWKLHPVETENYLLKWKDQCGRVIIQVATDKMEKEYRKKFRKSK